MKLLKKKWANNLTLTHFTTSKYYSHIISQFYLIYEMDEEY